MSKAAFLQSKNYIVSPARTSLSVFSFLEILFHVQFILFFLGISISAGGGENPDKIANNIIYLKAFALGFPIIVLFFLSLRAPVFFIRIAKYVAIKNNLLIMYVFLTGLSVPLALSPSFSANRWLYMCFSLIGLSSCIIQFYAIYGENMLSGVKKIVFSLSFLAVSFPLFLIINFGYNAFFFNLRGVMQEAALIHPSILSSIYAHLLAVHFCMLFFDEENKAKIVNIIFIVFLGFMIAMLFSRGVMIGLTIACLIISFLSYIWYKNTMGIFLALLLTLALTVIIIFVFTDVVHKTDLLRLFARGETDPEYILTLTNRTTLWQTILGDLGVKIFLIGNGYAVMTEGFGVNFGTGTLYGAHNGYLSIFLGSGILALLCILFYFTKGFFIIRNKRFFLPKWLIITSVMSMAIFLAHNFVAEEMGLNITVTFSYMVLIINLISSILPMNREKNAPSSYRI